MPHLIGERIYLREYRVSDLDAIHRWRWVNEFVEPVRMPAKRDANGDGG